MTLEGQEELAALMSEGLGDHVFFWRLYQVRAGSMLTVWLMVMSRAQAGDQRFLVRRSAETWSHLPMC